jgi:DNA-binding transcriptional MerR regulator
MTAPRYTIGEFSRLSRLTVTTLRHYDEIGLLPPAEVDRATGYRYYDAGQLASALRLGVLRSAGVPLADLLELVRGRRALVDVLEGQRRRVEAERVEQERRLALLDDLAREPADAPVVEEVVLQPRTVAVLTRTGSWDGLERTTRHALARLQVRLRQRGIEPSPPHGALFPVDPAGELTVVAYTGVDLPADVDVVELPGGAAVRTAHVGSPELLPYAYRALLAVVASRALVTSGPVREEYHDREGGPPSTDLLVLVAPGSSPTSGQSERSSRC